MSLIQNKIQKFKEKNYFKRRSLDSKMSFISRTNNLSNNNSKIFDVTYNLFSKKDKIYKNNNIIKIKKIESLSMNKNKNNNKTTSDKRYSNICNKNKKLKTKKNRTYSEMKSKKINKINSIIINISNPRYNKTNIKQNSSFRNSTNSKKKEKYFNISTNSNNKNNEYFYDFTTNKINIDRNNFNLYKTNTYNNKNKSINKYKNYNYIKIKHKLNKNKIEEKNDKSDFDFKIYKRSPVKIKTNIISNIIKNKNHIKKYHSQKLYNVSMNMNNTTKNRNNNKLLHKFLSSNNLYNRYTIKKINLNNMTQKTNKSAEKNYLEKWQLINGINIEIKNYLSQGHSKKNLNKNSKKFGVLGNNKIFSYKHDNNDKIWNNIYYYNNNESIRNINNIKAINNGAYNNTENSQEYNNKIFDEFLLKSIKTEKKMKCETEKKMLNSSDKIGYHKDEIENKKMYINKYKSSEINNINKIIERKKREIDLLNVMKFTSEMYEINNNENINNNDNYDNIGDNDAKMILNKKNKYFNIKNNIDDNDSINNDIMFKNNNNHFDYINKNIYCNYEGNLKGFSIHNNKNTDIKYKEFNKSKDLNENIDMTTIINMNSTHNNTFE